MEGEGSFQRGLTPRAVVIGLTLLALSGLWIERSELVVLACQVSESVPTIPALAAVAFLPLLTLSRRVPTILLLAWLAVCGFLLPFRLIPKAFESSAPLVSLSLNFLLLLAPALVFLLARKGLGKAEVVVIYIILAVGTSMPSVGVIRMLFPILVAPFYFTTPENKLDLVNRFIPRWWGPRDSEVLRQLYEGSPNEMAPWGVWAKYLSLWGLFFLILWLAFLGMSAIIRRQWTERERLSYPLVQLVSETLSHRGRPIFFDLVFWGGFFTSFLYNALNMGGAFNPAVPHPGKFFDLGALFTEHPWTGLRPMVIHFRPETFGIGYFMSLEVLLSVWVFFLLLRFESLLATAAGLHIPGFPFPREQSQGAFIALAIYLLYVTRGHLKSILKGALGRKDLPSSREEPLSYRAALGLFLGGLVFLLGWALLSGMWWWTALLYLGLIFGTALVYARIRAETGAPMIWLFPWYEQKKFIVNVFGSKPLMAGGDLSNLAVLSGLFFLSRGYILAVSAYQIEGFKLADETGMKRKEMTWALVLALVAGLIIAYAIHLHAYYKFGANVLEGGTTEGGYRTYLAVGEFTELARFVESPKPPDISRIIAYSFGFLLTGALVVVRAVFLRFPLHPLGFAMVTAYDLIWGPLFAVWVVKLIILRLGGVRLYRRLIPFFIGIIMGHYITAGLVWGLISAYGGEELFRRYGVWFG